SPRERRGDSIATWQPREHERTLPEGERARQPLRSLIRPIACSKAVAAVAATLSLPEVPGIAPGDSSREPRALLDAAARALLQVLSPPFRGVLLKSAGTALVLLLIVGIVLQRLLAAALRSGGAWLDATFQGAYQGAINLMEVALAVLAGLGVFAGLVFLMPAVTALVASVFADEIAEEVERT